MGPTIMLRSRDYVRTRSRIAQARKCTHRNLQAPMVLPILSVIVEYLSARYAPDADGARKGQDTSLVWCQASYAATAMFAAERNTCQPRRLRNMTRHIPKSKDPSRL